MTRIRLNRKLVLETPQPVADGAGGYRQGWAVLGEMWADIRPAGHVDADVGETARLRERLQVVVRAAPVGSDRRVLPGQRFRQGVQVLRVLAVSEHDPRGRYLRCETEKEMVR